MQYKILSIFRSLLCVFLFRLSKQLIPPIPPVQVHLPFTKNKEDPNLYDVSLTIKFQSISLPLNLFSNVTLIPSFDNIIQTKPNGLFESNCLTQSSLVKLDNIPIVDGYNLKEMTYQEGKKYIDNCSFRGWLGLSKSSQFIYDFTKSEFSSINQYEIKFTDKESGVLTIGDLSQVLEEQNNRLIFCRNSEDPIRRWGCEMRGVIPDTTLEQIPLRDNAISLDTDNKTSLYYLTIKKSKTGDRYENAFFDTTFQYILVPFKFITYLQQYQVSYL